MTNFIREYWDRVIRCIPRTNEIVFAADRKYLYQQIIFRVWFIIPCPMLELVSHVPYWS